MDVSDRRGYFRDFIALIVHVSEKVLQECACVCVCARRGNQVSSVNLLISAEPPKVQVHASNPRARARTITELENTNIAKNLRTLKFRSNSPAD